MKKYLLEIDKLIMTGLIDQTEIFTDFEFSDYFSDFEYIYNELFKIFEFEANKYSLKNFYLIYKNAFNNNAYAGFNKNTYIIKFTSGLVVNVVNRTLKNDELIEYNKRHEKFSKYLDIPVERLIYQFCFLFTFYHEFAHLLQFTKSDKFYELDEESVLNTYEKEKHYQEIDADTFSSIQLARHISQYCRQHFSDSMLEISVEYFTQIICSNLYYYISNFEHSESEIYYYERKHPHPFIRIVNILNTINSYLKIDINLVEKNVKPKNQLLPIFSEIENLKLNQVYSNYNFINYKFELPENIEKIVEYLNDITSYKSKNFNSALEIFNKNII